MEVETKHTKGKAHILACTLLTGALVLSVGYSMIQNVKINEMKRQKEEIVYTIGNVQRIEIEKLIELNKLVKLYLNDPSQLKDDMEYCFVQVYYTVDGEQQFEGVWVTKDEFIKYATNDNQLEHKWFYIGETRVVEEKENLKQKTK